MVSSEIISQILAMFKGKSQQYNVGSFISNDNGASFYLSSKRGATPVQIRLSNHGTYLKTWVDRTHLEDSRERLLDPSHCVNISVIFIDEGQDITKDCPARQDCEGCLIQPCVPQTFEGQNELGHPFHVKQYCYQSKYIRPKYINGIVKAIFEAIIKGEYIDPLASLKRAAKPKTLSSKQEITNDAKTNKNMKKNVVKINENTLKQIVAESVKKVLKESIDNPFASDGKYADGLPEITLDDVYENGYKLKNAFKEFATSLTHSDFSSTQNGLFRQCITKWNEFQSTLDEIIELATRYED